MQQSPPPGWYDDPNGAGRRRWWDGSRWTDHYEQQQQQHQQQYQQPGHTPALGIVTDEQARNWAMMAHLSALIAAFIGFAFVGPLIVYLVKKDDHPFIRKEAAEALNFQLSWLIWAVAGGILLAILIVLIIGVVLIPVAIAAAVAWLVLTIVAGVKAGKGESYRYPLTIRFID